MKRYTIIDKDPLSISIDGYVRLEDPDTGASVATVFVSCEEPKHEDDFETPITEESARRLRSLEVNPEMEELCRAIILDAETWTPIAMMANEILDYIETGEEE